MVFKGRKERAMRLIDTDALHRSIDTDASQDFAELLKKLKERKEEE